MFDCDFSNPVVSVECSFDDGPAESCSFPLEVRIGRFGTDNHTVVVTVFDEFGQSLNLAFNFSLIPPLPGREGDNLPNFVCMSH